MASQRRWAVALVFVARALAAGADDREPSRAPRSVASTGTLHVFNGIGAGAIPDGQVGTPPMYGAPRAITFPVSGIVGKPLHFEVGVDVTHSWVGDLDLVLAAPGGGPSITIASRIGVTVAGDPGDSSNLSGSYVFNDLGGDPNIWTAATGACGDACNVANSSLGGYRPTAPGGPGQSNPPPFASLDTTFAGLTPAQANGAWTLRIRDGRFSNTGIVTSAYLAIRASDGKGDFNHDGQSDIVFRSVAGGVQHKVWLMNGSRRLSEEPIVPDSADSIWELRGVTDFDNALSPGSGKDGNADLLFWNRLTGAAEIWLMNGTQRVGAPVPLPDSPYYWWEVIGTGHFTQGAEPAIVWRSGSGVGEMVMWFMNGTQVVGAARPDVDHADYPWLVVAVADYNDDGVTDFLWYNSTSGRLVTWYLVEWYGSGGMWPFAGQFTTPAGPGNQNWKVVASADYSQRDPVSSPPFGSPDILFRNESSGSQVVWHMDFASGRVNGEFTTPAGNAQALDWLIVGPR